MPPLFPPTTPSLVALAFAAGVGGGLALARLLRVSADADASDRADGDDNSSGGGASKAAAGGEAAPSTGAGTDYCDETGCGEAGGGDRCGACGAPPADWEVTDPFGEEAALPYTWTGLVVGATETAGRGLFATASPARGQLLHTAPVIVVPMEEYANHAKHTTFEHYLFKCKDGDLLLALGYGSLFNHARQPNVNYRLDKEAGVIRYYAALGRAFTPGDELCIYYGEDKELWFDMPPEEEDGE